MRSSARKTTYAQIDLVDLPGLNFSEEQKKGKNPFLAAVRNVDALVAVIQVFAEGAPHVLGEVVHACAVRGADLAAQARQAALQ